eukprot:scaffold66634_cov39-Phaeocystis_antarctica.AAC.1
MVGDSRVGAAALPPPSAGRHLRAVGLLPGAASPRSSLRHGPAHRIRPAERPAGAPGRGTRKLRAGRYRAIPSVGVASGFARVL